MSIVLAPDSFKGSLSQMEAAEAMARGLSRWLPESVLIRRPMADGGEGTAAVIATARGGTFHTCPVLDAYGRSRTGRFLLLPDRTAVIEAAAGPGYVPPEERPAPGRAAHSRGLGLLMNEAIARGARRLVVTLGGTGSSDGGMGALLELGARIEGVPAPGAFSLPDVSAVHLKPVPVPLEVWTDVLPPLTGPRGAIRRYGPQKGLAADELAFLDDAMARYGARLDRAAGTSVSTRAGAGAAGGLGAALAAVGGRLVPGGIAVARAIGLPAALSEAQAVLTGEGAVDAQSADGKVVGVVARLAREARVPVLVVAGRVDPDAEALYSLGVHGLFSLSSPLREPSEADLEEARSRIEARMGAVLRWLDPGLVPRYRIPGG